MIIADLPDDTTVVSFGIPGATLHIAEDNSYVATDDADSFFPVYED